MDNLLKTIVSSSTWSSIRSCGPVIILCCVQGWEFTIL